MDGLQLQAQVNRDDGNASTESEDSENSNDPSTENYEDNDREDECLEHGFATRPTVPPSESPKSKSKQKQILNEDDEKDFELSIESQEESDHSEAVDVDQDKTEDVDSDRVSFKSFHHSFSIGVDAKITMAFHLAREANPEAFTSRGMIYFLSLHSAASYSSGNRNEQV